MSITVNCLLTSSALKLGCDGLNSSLCIHSQLWADMGLLIELVCYINFHLMTLKMPTPLLSIILYTGT